MAEHTSSLTSGMWAMLSRFTRFDGKNPEQHREWSSKLKAVLNLGDKKILELIMKNEHIESLILDDRTRLQQANQDLWSILFFAVTGDACTLVKEFEGTTSSDGVGDGIGAWKALEDKYNPSNKGAKAALYSKLESTTMVPGQDPDLFFIPMEDYRRRLHAMGETITDDRFEGWVLKAMAPEYEHVRAFHLSDPDFGVAKMKAMMKHTYTNLLATNANTASRGVRGRGTAMAARGASGARKDVECFHCHKFGHFRSECPNRRHQHGKKGKPAQNQKHESAGGKWCSFHKTKNHGDDECRHQQQAQQKNNNVTRDNNVGTINFANLAQQLGQLAQLGQLLNGAGDIQHSQSSAGTGDPSVAEDTSNSSRPHITFTAVQQPEPEPEPVPMSWPFGDVSKTSGQEVRDIETTTGGSAWRTDTCIGGHLELLVDSGASSHFVDPELTPGLQERLQDFKLLSKPMPIETAGKHIVYGIAEGTVDGTIIDWKKEQRQVHLRCVMVPGLGRHLFSVKTAASHGVTTIFDLTRPRLESDTFTMPMNCRDDNLYTIRMRIGGVVIPSSVQQRPELALTADATADLWHRRMGHLNRRALQILAKKEGNGMDFAGTVSSCEVCAIGKSAQQAHPKNTRYNINEPFEMVVSDLMGPITPAALGGYKYVSKITDIYSRWKEVYLIKTKEEAVDSVVEFVKKMVIPMGRRVKIIRTDRGGEYTSKAFERFCDDTAIKHEFACTSTPQQVGISERDGKTLAAIVRCMLQDSKLPKFLWGELMFAAAYVANRSPHSALGMVSPYKKLLGEEANLKHLRVIGAKAFVHIETHTKKLEPKAWTGYLCGYSGNSKGYRIYNPATKQVLESRNVTFIETPPHIIPAVEGHYQNQGFERLQDNYETEEDFLRDLRDHTGQIDINSAPTTAHHLDHVQHLDENMQELLDKIRVISQRDQLLGGQLESQPEEAKNGGERGTEYLPSGEPRETAVPRSSARGNHQVTRAVTRSSTRGASAAHTARVSMAMARDLRSLAMFSAAATPDMAHRSESVTSTEVAYVTTNTQWQSRSEGERIIVIPNTFSEAMRLPEAAKWKAASDKEMEALEENKVYTLVPATSIPTGMKSVGSKWVYKVKADGSHKGRVVVQGWGQVHGVDCGGTHAPVCRLQSIRTMLATAAEFDLEVLMLDVQTAFLNADVEEEVYVRMPDGYQLKDKNGVPFVMKLAKSLYGLRQSPKNWHGTIDPFLTEIGFTATKSDPCLYIFTGTESLTKPKTPVFLTLYVDDLLLLGSDKELLKNLKLRLMRRFKMSDMGDVSLVLGMEVSRDRESGTLTLSQENYTKAMVGRFGMEGCKHLSTPGVGPELSINQPEEQLLDEEGKKKYQGITGSAMYLAQTLRYDIMYAVNQLSRAMSKPSKAHMAAAKHLLRYLAGTVDFSIVYKRGGFKLTAFSDANWGNNPDNGKSTSSYIVIMANAPVSFKVAQQGITAQSTMEAELVAAALTMKEAVYCSNMMMELGFGEDFNSVPVFVDNISALHVAGNRTYSPTVKHVALRFFFINELVEEGKITVHYIKTEDQIADIGTKHLSKPRHRYLLDLIKNFNA